MIDGLIDVFFLEIQYILVQLHGRGRLLLPWFKSKRIRLLVSGTSFVEVLIFKVTVNQIGQCCPSVRDGTTHRGQSPTLEPEARVL